MRYRLCRRQALLVPPKDSEALAGALAAHQIRVMFCDDDLTETARGDGKLIDARHVVFPHRHFTVGGLHFDATYARERSRLAWLQGFRVFRKRTAVDFGRKPRTIAVRLIEARVEAKFWCQMALHKGKRLAMRLTGRVSDRLPD